MHTNAIRGCDLGNSKRNGPGLEGVGASEGSHFDPKTMPDLYEGPATVFRQARICEREMAQAGPGPSQREFKCQRSPRTILLTSATEEFFQILSGTFGNRRVPFEGTERNPADPGAGGGGGSSKTR